LHPRHEAEHNIIGIASMWLRYPSLGVCKTVIYSHLREAEWCVLYQRPGDMPPLWLVKATTFSQLRDFVSDDLTQN
jgi:hypothetical protein